MDPVTHGLIGLGLSAFSGNPVSLSSPESLACALGAMTPDLDIVVKVFKNDFEYLRKHRELSHSLPALAGFAAVITMIFNNVFVDMNIFSVFFWALIGGISHTLFDILNTYGARFIRKRRRANLLTLYDPLILFLTLFLIINRHNTLGSNLIVALIFFAYMGTRLFLRSRAKKKIAGYYEKDHNIKDITVIPGLKYFYKWDYIVSTNGHNFLGEYNNLTQNFKEVRSYKKLDYAYERLFEESNIGKCFLDISKNYQMFEYEENGLMKIRVADLRFYFRNQFMHNATFTIDEKNNVVDSYFHPYKFENKIPIK